MAEFINGGLHLRFQSEKLILIIIDHPEVLGQIDNRLRQLMGKPECTFLGISVFLMGDFSIAYSWNTLHAVRLRSLQ